MIYVATQPVDFRKGAEGLALLAKEMLGHDPMKGVAVVFRAKRADRVKIVVWDGSGLVILHLLQLQLRVLAPVTS
ncbi:IS66 family insertion sequence element accessory protein TnpB [Bradyrhizobium sp. USDA 4518]